MSDWELLWEGRGEQGDPFQGAHGQMKDGGEERLKASTDHESTHPAP